MDVIVEKKLNEWRTARLFGQQNCQDAVVIERLRTAPLSSLSVDSFAYLLCQEGTPANDANVLSLRAGLIGIYVNAAQARFEAKAAEARLRSGRKALSFLRKALKSLGDVQPPVLRELALECALGLPIDDPKGEHESNRFGGGCQRVELSIVKQVPELERLIKLEEAKKPAPRKKRLRVLVDLLADWWVAKTGRSVAPYVVANRRDGDKAIVHEKRGEFISLAVALLGDIDRFKKSEIISAVINMHKDRTAKAKIANKTA